MTERILIVDDEPSIRAVLSAHLRRAGFEVQTAVDGAAAITLLESVAGKPRRAHRLSVGPAARAILRTKPAAWFRLDEFSGPRARDSSGRRNDGVYEPRVAYYLEGPHSAAFGRSGEKNRALPAVGRTWLGPAA